VLPTLVKHNISVLSGVVVIAGRDPFAHLTVNPANVNDAEFVLTSFNVQQNNLNGEKGTTQFLFQNSKSTGRERHG
jgi:hypothetical protein